MATLQSRIKEQRLNAGLTLLEVANFLGVKEATAQRYESGEIKNIKHETIVELANLFNCNPSYLMGWIDDPTNITEHPESPNFSNASLSCEFTEIEINLINAAKKLNTDGKEILLDYADMLSKNPKYKIDNM